MKLNAKMRQEITKRLLAPAQLAHEAALKRHENALALRMVKHRYGDDVFEKARALPEGWLPLTKTLNIDSPVYLKFPYFDNPVNGRRTIYSVSLAEAVPLPWNASHGWTAEVIGAPLIAKLHDYALNVAEYHDEAARVRAQITAALASYTTVDKLAAGWPEGYAALPAELLAETGGLPAVRLQDLNERIEALRKVA